MYKRNLVAITRKKIMACYLKLDSTDNQNGLYTHNRKNS